MDRNKKLSNLNSTVEQLAQAGELSEAGALTAGVIHEINTPLTTIQLCIESAQHALKELEDVPRSVFDQLEMVQASVDRISELTGQVAQLIREDKKPQAS